MMYPLQIRQMLLIVPYQLLVTRVELVDQQLFILQSSLSVDTPTSLHWLVGKSQLKMMYPLQLKQVLLIASYQLLVTRVVEQ